MILWSISIPTYLDIIQSCINRFRQPLRCDKRRIGHQAYYRNATIPQLTDYVKQIWPNKRLASAEADIKRLGITYILNNHIPWWFISVSLVCRS